MDVDGTQNKHETCILCIVISMYITDMYVYILHTYIIPVVPHKAVAEVSKIGHL